MPKLGLTMTEGTVVEWQVAEGASFKAGQPLVVIETDKVANEIEAPEDGELLRCLVQKGETVPVGAVLAEWKSQRGDGARAPERDPLASPPASTQSPLRLPASAVQLAAARRVTQSKQQIPHFYLSTEIDVGALQARRADWNAQGQRPKLTLTHLFVAAVARVLAARPELNRVWEGDGYVALPSVDVGVAVNTAQGLLVPMVRCADRDSLEALVRKTTDLVERARRGELGHADVGGGAITVSNAGMLNVTYMGSIINPGQAAILGVGSARQTFRPDTRGNPRVVSEIGVTLSCDHRVLDGAQGLLLLNGVRELLESPGELFALN
jgi:pyruvate dehydrogenase E2 component (dihydrolipoamide acetyltransferase)